MEPLQEIFGPVILACMDAYRLEYEPFVVLKIFKHAPWILDSHFKF
jgi:hypothetical protein